MNDTRARILAVSVLVAGGLGSASAQESGKVMIDVADCIKLEASDARLACYEARVAAVFGERAAQAAAVRPASAPPAPATPARAPEPAPTPAPAPQEPRATTAASAPSAAPARPPTPAAAAAAPAPSRGDRQSRREQNDKAAANAEVNDIVSRVKEVREVLPNSLQITLENGQIWRQTVSKQYELRPGQQVRIYGTRWGSASRLSADELNGYIQVERAR